MMSTLNTFLSLLCGLLCLWVGSVSAQSKYEILKEDWCGDANCYDILGVSPLDDRRAIKTRYNNISMTLHPDKNPNATDEEKALYVRVNKAYEILSNPQLRDKYDEYLKLKSSLDSPRENIFFVLILLYLLIVFVVLQYQKQQHNGLRKGILDLPQVQQWLKTNKGIDTNNGSKSKKKGRRGRGKKATKGKKGSASDLNNLEEEEDVSGGSWMDSVTDNVINETLNELNTVIPGWTGEAPTFQKAAVDVPMFILNKSGDLIFFIKWHIQHTLLKQELSNNEREELCRRNFQVSTEQWDSMDDSEKRKMLNRPGPWKVSKDSKKKKKN